MQVEKLSGHDLGEFLLSLEPEGWDRSAAVIDRTAASHVSMPLTDGACRQYIGLVQQ